MIQCKCGIDAKLVEVKKDGPNKGKKFYACSKPRNEQCDFFKWQWDESKGDIATQPNKGILDTSQLDKIEEKLEAVLKGLRLVYSFQRAKDGVKVEPKIDEMPW